jgi:hypothetical protein
MGKFRSWLGFEGLYVVEPVGRSGVLLYSGRKKISFSITLTTTSMLLYVMKMVDRDGNLRDFTDIPIMLEEVNSGIC